MLRSPPVLCLAIAVWAGACEARAALGTACTRASDCPSGLACRSDRCRAECRDQRDCPLGTLCLVGPGGDGSCSLPDDPDCRVSGCTDGLACVGGACVNLCSTIAECPPGSTCVPTTDGRARCARSDEDAGPIDAGPNEAGPSDAGIDAPNESGDAEPRDAGPGCTPGRACDPIVQMAAGDGFVCVRTASRALWCWGGPDDVGRGAMLPTECTKTACPPGPVQIELALGDVRPATDVAWVSGREYGACLVTGGRVGCW